MKRPNRNEVDFWLKAGADSVITLDEVSPGLCKMTVTKQGSKSNTVPLRKNGPIYKAIDKKRNNHE